MLRPAVTFITVAYFRAWSTPAVSNAGSLVHPREVFRAAVKDAAKAIILVHNHPSGDPTPSDEDFALTRRLEDAGRMMGIDILDHIIVARNGSASIRDRRQST